MIGFEAVLCGPPFCVGARCCCARLFLRKVGSMGALVLREICDESGKVVFVENYGADADVKISNNTKNIISIEIKGKI